MHPLACPSIIRGAAPVYVPVRLLGWIHVPLPALSACRSYARAYTPLDLVPRACTGRFRCLGPLHVFVRLWPLFCVVRVHEPVRLWTWIHVPAPALFGV